MASKVIYTAAAVVGIVAASGAAWWYQSKPSGPKEMPPNTSAGGAAGAPASAASAPAVARPAGVEVAKVEKASLQDDAQSVGTLRSRQSVMMRPEVPGRVRQLAFTDGQRVRKGQVLVQLDDVLQRAEIKQGQAQVSIALANLKRNQELVTQNFVTQRVLEESAANLQVAEAQLALSCARLSRMAILAPFDATVGIRNVNVGDFVKDGADLINLEDTSSMYVDFRLPERFQGKVRLQQVVELTLDAFPGRAFKARIEAIDPLLDVNGRSVGIRAVLPNTTGEPAREAGRGGQGAGGSGGPGGRPGASGGATGGAAAAVGGGSTRPAGTAMGQSGRPGGADAIASGAGLRGPGASGGTIAAAGNVDANGCPADAVVAAPVAAAVGPTSPQGGQRNAAGPRSGAAIASGGAGTANLAPLRPGMFARVNTVFSINDAALLIPEEAIVPQGGRQFVIKSVTPDQVPSVDKAKLPEGVQFVSLRQEVRLGVRRAGRVEVLSGLNEGESVVVAGHQRLQRDGSPLRVVELGRSPGGAAGAGSAGGASGVGAAASAASGGVAGAPAVAASR